MKKQMDKYLWIEKYRPMNINDILLPKKRKTFFEKLVKNDDIPNLFLYSNTPGTGKTTLAKAICNELGIDYMYINTSLDTGIDTLRNRITKYASVKTLDGKKKIIIMDEFDGATSNLQEGLRASMESFHKSCRFIFTANYITKIIEPLKSRCQLIDFNLTEKEIKDEMIPLIEQRLKGILKFEKVEYIDKVLNKLINTFYPDIRKMIGLLEQYNNTVGIINNDIFNFDLIDEKFYEYIDKKQLTKARKYLLDTNKNIEEVYRELFDNYIPRLSKEKQGQGILIIAEYMNNHSMSIDPEINLIACLLELMGL